jgi:light-harvesting complex 1 alpha chain
MHRIWLIFEPRSALIGLFSFLLALALLIHFVLLSSADFNWLAQPAGAVVGMPGPTPWNVASPAAAVVRGKPSPDPWRTVGLNPQPEPPAPAARIQTAPAAQ